jgi:hypothetical protein
MEQSTVAIEVRKDETTRLYEALIDGRVVADYVPGHPEFNDVVDIRRSAFIATRTARDTAGGRRRQKMTGASPSSASSLRPSYEDAQRAFEIHEDPENGEEYGWAKSLCVTSGEREQKPELGSQPVCASRGQAFDVRERHVDRRCHRCDIARGLGQQVPALQCAHEPGRELVDRRLGRKHATVLKPAQHACQESLPFDEKPRQGQTGDVVVIGDLRGQ